MIFFAIEAPASKQAAIAVYWGFLLAFLLASFLFALRVPEEYLSRKIVNPNAEVAFTGQNALAVLSVLLDGLQLVAVLLMSIRQEIRTKISDIEAIDAPPSKSHPDDIESFQTMLDGIETITGIAFLQVWNSEPAQLLFISVIAAAAGVCLMILLSPLASMMIHYERRPTSEMKKANVDRALAMTRHMIYKTVVTLSVTFSVSIVESLSVVLNCSEGSDNTDAMVLEDGWFPETVCWSPQHALLAIVAMTIISVYVTVCQVVGVYFGRIVVKNDDGLDIRYSQAYMHVTTGLCALLSLCLSVPSRVLCVSFCPLSLSLDRFV